MNALRTGASSVSTRSTPSKAPSNPERGELRLEATQRGSQAIMGAMTEGEMLVGRSVGNEPIGPVELTAITVGRPEPHHDAIASIDVSIRKGDGLGGESSHHLNRGPTPEHFLDRRR